ncbi:hypothetical protein [Bacillus badius]|uniref:Phage protein Gp138 N-terminal domain-containing protein n=1 Tax=Bacillus badius TaxID=1455 RepID=A0ABR5ANQ8_BACBA|nr:hypothetical protein [Bacillus badius]KIL72516.1 hypothetical protein SD77_3489 [Bacillus badius]MED4718295.1 hypothetical protein [Bacillus badius]
MANDTKFYLDLINVMAAKIKVAAPARVMKVNGDGTADIVPLYIVNGEKADPILGAPYLKHVNPPDDPLRINDVVYAVFADRQLDNMNGSQSFKADFPLLHRETDAVIVGVFA